MGPGPLSLQLVRRDSKLNKSFLMADYLEAIRGLNVVKSVHVEADETKGWVKSPLILTVLRPHPSCVLWGSRSRIGTSRAT